MSIALIALTTSLLVPDPTWIRQTEAPTAAPAAADAPVESMILDGATAAPDCGGRAQLAAMAFCVTAPLGNIGALADAYIAHLGMQGWLTADGDDNRVVFVRRREGVCDGLQMMAFYNEDQPAEATAPGFLAFSPIPGNLCAAATPPAQPSPSPVEPQAE